MGKIKKILENELVGGTQTTDVYPVTSTKAVYDENNERLDKILEASQAKLSELDSQVIPLIGGDSVLHSEAMQDGAYEINVSTYIVGKTTRSRYKTCSPIDISNIKEDTDITIKSSIVSSVGVYLCDENMVAIDYINGTNAEERGYAITTQYQDISIKKTTNAKYIVSSLRDAYNPTINDFDVRGTIIGKIPQVENDIKWLKDKSSGNYVKTSVVIGKNILDLSKKSAGFLNANGSIAASENYFTSDYIEVKQGQTITLSPKIRMIGAFTAKNPSAIISDSYVNSGLSGIQVWTATQDCYVRATFYANNIYENWMIQYGDAIQYEDKNQKPKIAYQEYVENNKIEEGVLPSNTIGKIGNVLYGKKWVVLGDSFTHGIANDLITEGIYKGEPQNYPYLIGNRNAMNIVKFFSGGRTMAYPADGTFENSVTCPTSPWYFQNIPSDADYITIMLGINDLNHSVGTGEDGEDYTGRITLGTIDDTDTSTYYGAYNTVMSWLMVNRPFAHVGIIVTNRTQNEAFTSAQIEIAKKYGVPYINLNGDQHTPAMIRAYNPNLPQFVKDAIKNKQAVDLSANNTHPNTAAHNYESTFIENWLRGL